MGSQDGPGSSATFNTPWSLSMALDGSVVIADLNGARLRRLDTQGNVTTIAGSTGGFADGPALTTALLSSPSAVHVDSLGRTWVGDNTRVRLLAAATQICNDFSVCTNDSCDKATGKCVYAAISNGTACNDGDACTSSETCDGKGACVGTSKSCDDGNPCTSDPCNVYSAVCEHLVTKDKCDDGNACTLDDQCLGGKCVIDQAFVYTLAGSAQGGLVEGAGADARFNSPRGPAVDAKGVTFVADTGNHRIRTIAADGTTTTLAGGQAGYLDGPASSAKFNAPRQVALDSQGSLIVADTGNQRIRKVAADGTVTTVAGSGQAGYFDGAGSSAQFNAPYALAIGPGGKIYVADTGNLRIRIVATDGTVSTLAGSGQSGYTQGAVTSASFNSPRAIAVDGKGVVYVGDTGNHAIRRIFGGTVDTLAGGKGAGFVDGPAKVAAFNSLEGVAVDAAGAVFVADLGNRRIRRIYAGQVTTIAGDGSSGLVDGPGATARFVAPVSIAVAPSNHLYLVDNHAIRKVTQPVLICDDGDACTLDSCGKGGGGCTYTPVGAGGACDDGDACTTNDVCSQNKCAGSAKQCPAGQICGGKAGSCGLFAGTTLLTIDQQTQIDTWAQLPGQTWVPCYVRSTDGANAAIFHGQCDNKGKTVTVIKAGNAVFGGFTAAPWNTSQNYSSDPIAFLFSVTQGTQHALKSTGASTAIYGKSDYGPTFGGGHDLWVNGAMSGGYSNLGNSYTCQGIADCKAYLAGSFDTWTVTEIEVFVAK